jgi:isopentenyl diphosphate isomerase/L-lactate dehydrogenase-like FMN-dependent dehydrogenase
MLQHQLHVADLGIIHVVAAEVDEAAWLYATDVMGGRLEAPWATSLTGLAHACADSATAIRRRSATARSLSAGDSAATDALALMSLWVPGVAQTQQRVREHYSAALDESAETTYPAWLLDGITPGVAAARAFLASTPADSAHPLRVADDVWVLAVCDRIAAMSD